MPPYPGTPDEDLQNGYELVVAPSAARAIRDRLPEAVAAAVVEFITGALLENPRRVGKPLHRALSGTFAARRGSYRVLYEIDEPTRTVRIIDASHRRDVYRPPLTRPTPSWAPSSLWRYSRCWSCGRLAKTAVRAILRARPSPRASTRRRGLSRTLQPLAPTGRRR